MKQLERRIADAQAVIREQCPAGIERREVPVSMELRDAGEDTYTFVGHAAVFDQRSQDLGGWTEQIKRGAFKRVLGDDVRFLVNHDPNLLLARTRSGTLRLKEDPKGLAVEADIAPTTLGKDLRVLLERGDMTQMSFAFTVARDGSEWDEDADGNLVRTVTRMGELFDVSPVTYPAYTQTDGGVRQDLAAERGEEESSDAPSGEEQPSEAVAARSSDDGLPDEPQVSDDTDAPEPEAWRLAGRQRRLRQRAAAL